MKLGAVWANLAIAIVAQAAPSLILIFFERINNRSLQPWQAGEMQVLDDITAVHKFLALHAQSGCPQEDHVLVVETQFASLKTKLSMVNLNVAQAAEIVEIIQSAGSPWPSEKQIALVSSIATQVGNGAPTGTAKMQTFFEWDNFLTDDLWDEMMDEMLSEYCRMHRVACFLAEELGLGNPKELTMQHNNNHKQQ